MNGDNISQIAMDSNGELINEEIISDESFEEGDSVKSDSKVKRTRKTRQFPSLNFQDALVLAEGLNKHGSGERVRLETLLKIMSRSPTSSTTRELITNSAKYGLTKGSYTAEFLELTEDGRKASSEDVEESVRRKSRFKLAIESVIVFELIYRTYKKKRLPEDSVISDLLIDNGIDADDTQVAISIFRTNSKFLGLIDTSSGNPLLSSIESVLDSLGNQDTLSLWSNTTHDANGTNVVKSSSNGSKGNGYENICFYITPIGDDSSDQRKHSNLFMNYIVKPALQDCGLKLVRADQIGDPGMITSQIIEHIMKAKLCIVDLSYHNPNAFYEMAIRHMCDKPIIQIIQKKDRIPFDVNQIRTIVIDNTDVYSLIPNMQSYIEDLKTQIHSALSSDQSTQNPISIFFPSFKNEIYQEGNGK